MNEGERLLTGEAILNERVTLAQSRDELVEDLVRQYSRLVYRIAYAALRNHPDAEDATQETFLRVLRYSHKLAGVENYKTWLARITWRVAVDRSQQRCRKRELPLDDSESAAEELPSSSVSADQAMHDAEVGEQLALLIGTLPAKLRDSLILSTVEEMSPAEVAATLGINEAAVRSRVFRARQILRKKLAGRVDIRGKR